MTALHVLRGVHHIITHPPILLIVAFNLQRSIVTGEVSFPNVLLRVATDTVEC